MWKPLVCTGINMDKLLPTSADCRYIFSYISIRSACDFTQAALGGSLYQAVMATAIGWTWVVELQFSLVLLLFAKKNGYKSHKKKDVVEERIALGLSKQRQHLQFGSWPFQSAPIFFQKVPLVAFHYTLIPKWIQCSSNSIETPVP